MTTRKKIVNRASFSLEQEYIDLLKRITDETRRSQTEELRCMIDNAAKGLGLEPVQRPVPTKA